jgi:xanthine/uracil/vitamin C permease (AzgA family)
VVDPRRGGQGGLRGELRAVLTVAGAVVGIVLAVAALAIFVPAVRDLFARLPIAIAVLLGGTAWVLWRITRHSPSR